VIRPFAVPLLALSVSAAAWAAAAIGRRIPRPAATPKASELEVLFRKVRLLISMAFSLVKDSSAVKGPQGIETFLATGCEDEPGAFASQCTGAGSFDTGARSGDECYFPFESILFVVNHVAFHVPLLEESCLQRAVLQAVFWEP
jgi:hypothetical protein